MALLSRLKMFSLIQEKISTLLSGTSRAQVWWEYDGNPTLDCQVQLYRAKLDIKCVAFSASRSKSCKKELWSKIVSSNNSQNSLDQH